MNPPPLRIGVVSPLFESVPPKFYGGTERIVSYLTEELVEQGHEVTLFASGDSQTSANLRPMSTRGLRMDPECRDPLSHHISMLDKVAKEAEEFDVIHFNIDYLHFPLVRHLGLRGVTTLHGRLDIPDLVPLFDQFNDHPLISISESQRRPLAQACWAATVYHGVPENLYSPGNGRGGYAAFLGRICPEKRPDRAIRIARRAGIPLKIAAKVDKADERYFDEQIRPMLSSPGVEYVGEISEREKNKFLGDAVALLFPIDWPEPFGLVMVEAMACGTPVVAWRCGSVPEIILDGESGYIVDNEDDAVKAVERAAAHPRLRCRDAFEQRFTSSHMAASYVKVFRRLAKRQLRPVIVA